MCPQAKKEAKRILGNRNDQQIRKVCIQVWRTGYEETVTFVRWKDEHHLQIKLLTGTGIWKHLSKDTGKAQHIKHWKSGWKILWSSPLHWQVNGLVNLQYISSFSMMHNLSSMKHYNVLKKCPERPHQLLKHTARVKRWSPVDLAKLTLHSSLTSEKHWDEEFNVCLLPVLTEAMFALWTAVNHCAFTRKSMSFLCDFPNERDLNPSSRLYVNTYWKLRTCLNMVQGTNGFLYGSRYFWTWNPPSY